MRIGAIQQRGGKAFGLIDSDTFRSLVAADGRALGSLPDVIAEAARGFAYGDPLALEDVRLVAPVGPLPKNVLCVGKNYHEHAREFARSGYDAGSGGHQEIPDHPIIFSKAANTIAGPFQAIDSSVDDTSTLDYEGEVGVVIGKRCKGATLANALDYVFGYTLVNDLTARALQRRHNQWFVGKNLDGFCPVGPWIVTADEVGDLDALELTTRVNGELRQRTTIGQMIFDIPTIIATLSAYMTLEPGDLIATGTPVGVGAGFTPPRFLKPGDEIRIALTGVGELTNTIS